MEKSHKECPPIRIVLGAAAAFLLSANLAFVSSPVMAKSERLVTLMSYNAENLFDTKDNPKNTGDNTYLPISQKGTDQHKALCAQEDNDTRKRECLNLDWSDDVLRGKLQNLAAVIDGAGNGDGPDIIVLQEVENLAVLNQLKRALTKSDSYVTAVNPETSPGRGINVAVLSKLPLAGQVKTHRVDFAEADKGDCGDTRDILEVPLRLPDGSALFVFGLHFPSGFNPPRCREVAAEALNAIASSRPQGDMLVAAGDTNINCSPADQPIISETLRDQWIVPDEVNKGCRAPGSNFYPRQAQWSFLDLIMTSRSLTSSSQAGAPWFADFGSFRTVISVPELQVDADNKGRVMPKRFDPKAKTGVTDHWPVMIDLVRRR